MSVSTFQKITFISCLVLCVSLFLPKIFLSRGKKDPVQSEVGPGHVPPLRYSQSFSEDHDWWQLEPLSTKPFKPEAISRTKGAGKPNLLGQVIPVYGFGIFLYVIYIFFKLTYKDRSPRQECRFPVLIPESVVQELPDYEMAQLQARLRQMEGVKERRASKANLPPARSRRGSRLREERKLPQLRQLQLTRVMLEGRPLEGVSPEVEAEETPYSADWEGYPEETFPKYEVAFRRRRYPSVILEEPDMDVPTAEELAEGMGREKEENDDDDDGTDDDGDDEEEDEVKNDSDVDKVDLAEDSPMEWKEDGQNKQTDDEEDNEESEEDEEEEEEEIEPQSILFAEQIKQDDDEDEDDTDHKKEEEEEEVGEDQPCLPHDTDDEEQQSKGARKCREPPGSRRQITFSDHRHVFSYPKAETVGCTYEDEDDEDTHEEDEEEDDEDEEDDDMEDEDKQDKNCQKEVAEREEEDPLMEAESLCFHAEVECDPEEQEVNLLDFLLTYQPEATISSNHPAHPKTPVSGTLRMRHKKPKKKN